MKIALIGTGQQGTSQALAFAKLNHIDEIILHDITPEHAQQALKLARENGLDPQKFRTADNIEDAVKEADIIGINTPMNTFKEVAREVTQHAKTDAILYDNGSGKVQAEKDIKSGLGENTKKIRYIPLHLLVGRAGTGSSFADIEMYKDQTLAIMGDDQEAKNTLIQLFKGIGVKQVREDLSPAKHDIALGLYSHHNTFAVTALALAFEKANTEPKINSQEIKTGRFLSSTRVAAHGQDGATFWAPIAIDNKEAILEAAKTFSKEIQKIKEALETGNSNHLEALLEESSNYTNKIPKDRDFEGLDGDLASLNEMGQQDNAEAKAHLIAMPVLFATASALTAKDNERKGGEPFTGIGNSSFYDALRPARDDFQKSAAFIFENKEQTLEALTNFQSVYANIIGQINKGDRGQLEQSIKTSHAIRTEMPSAPTSARPEYTVQEPS